jgi:hypothetical protein
MKNDWNTSEIAAVLDNYIASTPVSLVSTTDDRPDVLARAHR